MPLCRVLGVALHKDDTIASDRDLAACNDRTSSQSCDKKTLELSTSVLTAEMMESMTAGMIYRAASSELRRLKQEWLMPRLQVQSRSWRALAPRHSRSASQSAAAICLVIRTKLVLRATNSPCTSPILRSWLLRSR